jgi:hypothetical protein
MACGCGLCWSEGARLWGVDRGRAVKRVAKRARRVRIHASRRAAGPFRSRVPGPGGRLGVPQPNTDQRRHRTCCSSLRAPRSCLSYPVRPFAQQNCPPPPRRCRLAILHLLPAPAIERWSWHPRCAPQRPSGAAAAAACPSPRAAAASQPAAAGARRARSAPRTSSSNQIALLVSSRVPRCGGSSLPPRHRRPASRPRASGSSDGAAAAQGAEDGCRCADGGQRHRAVPDGRGREHGCAAAPHHRRAPPPAAPNRPRSPASTPLNTTPRAPRPARPRRPPAGPAARRHAHAAGGAAQRAAAERGEAAIQLPHQRPGAGRRPGRVPGRQQGVGGGGAAHHVPAAGGVPRARSGALHRLHAG